MFFRTPYNYDRDAASLETAYSSALPSRTQQSMKDETNINTIVGRFLKTGLVPESVVKPSYGDFSAVLDYQTAQNALIAAEKNFMQLPSGLRARFHNDPQAFMDFCINPDNLDELRKLGLAKTKPVVENTPVVAPVVAPVVPPV